MLVFNKYLKELGYKKDDFPFKKKDERYSLDKEYGVVDAQTWELDDTIILELYTYLRYFQECCTKGIPGPFIDESKEDHGASDFRKMIQEVIDGLKAYMQAGQPWDYTHQTYEEYKGQNKQLNEQFQKAWKLLGENLSCFWW